jgi:hypothetical protein
MRKSGRIRTTGDIDQDIRGSLALGRTVVFDAHLNADYLMHIVPKDRQLGLWDGRDFTMAATSRIILYKRTEARRLSCRHVWAFTRRV